MFDEITASRLVKVDQQCNKVIDSPFPVNPAGFVIHSAVHEAREDVQCVLHTHTRAGVAVSAQKCGMLPISQQSTFVLASLAYHDYEGVAFRDDEKPRLQADLGDANFLVLRNHGLLTVGKTIADAFLCMYTFENTCRIQLDAQAGGGELMQVDPQHRRGRGAGDEGADRRHGRRLRLALADPQARPRRPQLQGLSAASAPATTARSRRQTPPPGCRSAARSRRRSRGPRRPMRRGRPIPR